MALGEGHATPYRVISLTPPSPQTVQLVIDALSHDPSDVGIGIIDTKTGKVYLAPASALPEGDHVSLVERTWDITDIADAAHIRGFVVGRTSGGNLQVVNNSGLNPANNRMEPELFESLKDIMLRTLRPGLDR